MKPYLQGALDGLCAVYSIVNAARIIADIDEEEAKELFKKILIIAKSIIYRGEVSPKTF